MHEDGKENTAEMQPEETRPLAEVAAIPNQSPADDKVLEGASLSQLDEVDHPFETSTQTAQDPITTTQTSQTWYAQPQQTQQASPKKRNGLVVALVISVVVCLLGGVAIGMLLQKDNVFSTILQNQITASPLTQSTQEPTKTDIPRPTADVKLGGVLPQLPGKDSPVVEIVDRVGPAVVGVTNLANVYDRFSGNRTLRPQSSGSGVIVSADGYIVTNNHVVSGADSLTVTLSSGKEVVAVLVGADDRSDLAVLKINEKNLTVVPLGDSKTIKVGQLAIAIGNPLGQELAGTVTVGIISGPERTLAVDSSGRTLKVLQTDAAINPGNSGGALVNEKGEVIGINTLKSTNLGYDQSGNPITAEGLGFAIPINEAKPIINELIRHGYISRPYLGVSGQDVNELDAQLRSVPQGFEIFTLYKEGPASKSGILQGDIIIKMNAKRILTADEMISTLNQLKPGDAISVTVYRPSDKKEYTYKITLGESVKATPNG